MSELIDTTEMYLRTVYELLEEGVPPLRARSVTACSRSRSTARSNTPRRATGWRET